MVKTVQEACAICMLHRKVSQPSSSCAGNKSLQTTFTTSKIGRDKVSLLVPLFTYSFGTWNTATYRESLSSLGSYFFCVIFYQQWLFL